MRYTKTVIAHLVGEYLNFPSGEKVIPIRMKTLLKQSLIGLTISDIRLPSRSQLNSVQLSTKDKGIIITWIIFTCFKDMLRNILIAAILNNEYKISCSIIPMSFPIMQIV